MLSRCRKVVSIAPVLAVLAGCGGGEHAGNAVEVEARPAVVADEGAEEMNGSAAAPVVPAAVSRFTSVAVKDCRTVEQTDEEGGFYRGICPGAAGYTVELTEGDLRQNLTLITEDGRRHSLDLGTLGSGFSTVGDTIEWRAPAGAPFQPRTLTFRFNVYENVDPNEKPTSFLAVARLGGGKPCIVARIAPGPKQSDEARRIADAATLPECRAR